MVLQFRFCSVESLTL